MNPEAPAVEEATPVGEALQQAEAKRLAVLFVVDEARRLRGFLTKKALTSASTPDLPVGKLVTPPPDVLTPEDPLERAAALLAHYVVLPVVDGERRLVGILSKDGLLRALSHLAALGEGGLRIRLRPHHPAEVYRALAILAQENLTLVAVLRGQGGEVILHIQGAEDPERLREKLTASLS